MPAQRRRAMRVRERQRRAEIGDARDWHARRNRRWLPTHRHGESMPFRLFRRTRRSSEGSTPSPERGAPRSFFYLNARSLSEARRRAARVVSRTRPSACCGSPLAHVFHRLGSTLFFDDDPEQLARAFPAPEREQFTPLFLAACIVLSGRERVSLFPAA
jgi:hypothetical protein